MKTISILGCGWLGLKLAAALLQKDNCIIKASTTSVKKTQLLEKEGFAPFILNFNQLDISDYVLNDFLECDVLVIAIPPKKEHEHYLNFLKQIMCHQKIPSIEQIIFISSTSVYPNSETIYIENAIITEQNTSKKIIYQAERIVKNRVILRCAGLMGYDRVAGKYFANKTVDCPKDPVNYVHADDIIEIVRLLIHKKIRNNIYNLCAPFHPSKEEVYISNALKHGFDKPIFSHNKLAKKRVIDGSKMTQELGYDYMYQNPLDFK